MRNGIFHNCKTIYNQCGKHLEMQSAVTHKIVAHGGYKIWKS